ncbi:hypothetical protein [Marinoscillum furvescens]|uniref:Outer membrane protein with beta-barrel domain n=1 Tax=Marinoscillum furvescens DSM 4134 TaxID=1122208 RepID=A0A3D9L4N3_MARFU|nr:hypothetical protein [Marinoscillum furvescens]RED97900.1 hypothetical protein C7460_11141 [Marinoscillum furvescens DSM 4134]
MKPVFITILMALSLTLLGQDIDFNLGVYGANFHLKDIRNLQEDFNGIFVGSEKTESFPPYLAFDASIRLKSRRGMIGPWFMYQSTGGRSYYEDRTGYFTTDMLLQGYTFGLSGQVDLTMKRTYFIYSLGVTYSSFLIEQRLLIFEELSGTYRDYYDAYNGTLIGGIEYELVRKPRISMIAQFDFSMLGSDIKRKEDKNGDFGDIPERKIDWSGFKIGLRMGISKEMVKDLFNKD